MATHELVVPKSIPITSPASALWYLRASRKKDPAALLVAVLFIKDPRRIELAADRRIIIEEDANIVFCCEWKNVGRREFFLVEERPSLRARSSTNE